MGISTSPVCEWLSLGGTSTRTYLVQSNPLESSPPRGSEAERFSPARLATAEVARRPLLIPHCAAQGDCLEEVPSRTFLETSETRRFRCGSTRRIARFDPRQRECRSYWTEWTMPSGARPRTSEHTLPLHPLPSRPPRQPCWLLLNGAHPAHGQHGPRSVDESRSAPASRTRSRQPRIRSVRPSIDRPPAGVVLRDNRPRRPSPRLTTAKAEPRLRTRRLFFHHDSEAVANPNLNVFKKHRLDRYQKNSASAGLHPEDQMRAEPGSSGPARRITLPRLRGRPRAAHGDGAIHLPHPRDRVADQSVPRGTTPNLDA